MKKIIIGVCAVMLGISAQAASVDWSSNAIQSSPDNAVAAGWLVEIYSSTVVYDYGAAKAGTISSWDSSATVAAGTTFRAMGSGVQAEGTTASYYAVVYDASTIAGAKNYIISDVVSVTTAANGASANLAFGAMSANTAANKFLNSSWTAVAVPEPTSGLLMLVGLAGLALRRRRA